jgi:X-Pro dipeptidyl-peptidase
VAGRAIFASGVLTRALGIAGSPALTLRIKVDRPTTELSARLVDYGRQRRVDYQSPGEGIRTLTTQSCWGASTAIDDACYYNTEQDYVTSTIDILTRGWLDAAHHVSLKRQTPLTPGTWYTITVPIDTTDAVVASGHRFAVVLTQSDREYTEPLPTGATVTIDPTSSALTVPVTGAYAITPSTSAATPAITGTAQQHVTTPNRLRLPSD